YGKGLYRNDSVSAASQAIAQDVVTLIVGIPLLILGLYLSGKGSLKGKLLLTGTLGYFLYTYTSYSFLAMYNPFFLIYVILMSASFFAFTLAMLSFDVGKLSADFGPKLPVKFIGGFSIFLGVIIALMWLGRIQPSLVSGVPPLGLEHYTTLIIQALDLGFIVPAALVAGVLVIRRKPFGYLLASVIIIKGITLLTAISAMLIGQIRAGIKVGPAETIIFPIFNVIAIYCLVLILKNVRGRT
ncbi:MAG TPA: hypothetical protein VF531_05865, partial [Bacillota bacterium]